MADGIIGKLCFPRVCPTAVGCNSGQWERWGAGVGTVGSRSGKSGKWELYDVVRVGSGTSGDWDRWEVGG